GFNASPMPRINLQINAELSSTRTRNPVAELPPASAAIMLAFPERFIRDASGSLATVDIRPVNLERQREDHLRYGFSLAVPIGPAPAPGRAAASDESVSIPDGDEGFAATSGGGGPRPRLQV